MERNKSHADVMVVTIAEGDRIGRGTGSVAMS